MKTTIAVLLGSFVWLTNSTNAANSVRVGVDQTGQNSFSGTIAVARVHDRALTDA